MISPIVFWSSALGVSFLIAGIWTHRRDLRASHDGGGLMALGAVFIAAPLATFAGEHFTIAKLIAQAVPKWIPAHLFMAYFVGVALLAAALSFVARRCLRWSTILLAIMFALFVVLMDLPATLAHPTTRLNWILAARQGTFAMGGLALFSVAVRDRRPKLSNRLAAITAFWTGMVIIFYGVGHILYPKISPGVPATKLTSSWVPLPLSLAYTTGALLIAFGAAMFIRKYAGSAARFAGLLMLLLTVVLYVPEFFLARTVPQRVTAINFIFDTLLFSGTLLAIARANLLSESKPISSAQTAI